MNTPRLVLVLALIAVCLAPSAASGRDEDEDEDEYDPRGFRNAIVGDTAALLEAGELEITFGGMFEDEDDKQSTELTVEFAYGVTDWFEFGVEVPYLLIHPDEENDVEGLGDMTISGAVPLFSRGPLFTSVKLAASLPTGNDDRSSELGEGRVIWEPSLAADLALGEEAELSVEFGGELARHVAVFNYEATFAWIFEDFGPFEEFVPSFGIEGSLDGGEREFSIVPGVGFPIIEDVELGLEGAIGLTPDTPNWRIGVELTLEF